LKNARIRSARRSTTSPRRRGNAFPLRSFDLTCARGRRSPSSSAPAAIPSTCGGRSPRTASPTCRQRDLRRGRDLDDDAGAPAGGDDGARRRRAGETARVTGRGPRAAVLDCDVVKTVCTNNCARSATVRMTMALVDHLEEQAPDDRRASSLAASSGNDIQLWKDQSDDTLVRAVALGIRSADPAACAAPGSGLHRTSSTGSPRRATGPSPRPAASRA
jgi:hypothetical protein